LLRRSEPQPYYGGDQLQGICTAGFAAYNLSTNTRGMITAGHCFSQRGVGVYQGTQSVQTGVIGELTIQSWGNNLPDSEFLDATSPFGTTVDAQVNVSLPQGQPVITTGTSWVGMHLCIAGSFTGENCTGTVQRTNFCALSTDGYTHCALDEVTNPNTSPIMCQPGDSGAPVYTVYSGTSIEAFAIHNGAINGHDCFETEIGAVVAQLGTPLLTVGFQMPTPSVSNILQPNAVLNPNTWLSSQLTQFGVTVWKYFLSMQSTDGNLVLYAPSGAALWSAGTQGNPNAYLLMQGDGNLVVYRQGGAAIWTSKTQGHSNAYLVMQGDGNLVIYAQSGPALWSTQTCCYKP
jgi:hypothetical protein